LLTAFNDRHSYHPGASKLVFDPVMQVLLRLVPDKRNHTARFGLNEYRSRTEVLEVALQLCVNPTLLVG
jgi:hypothetical protein